MRLLITGAAGFIGFHLSKRLLAEQHEIIGLDNLNAYYDVQLKQARLHQLIGQPGFRFERVDLANQSEMAQLFRKHQFDRVVNLAAQAGVRYSLSQPHAYVESNLIGFLNVLEGCRHTQIEHLVFASSSSVYGANSKMPFSVNDPTDHPLSLYGASKKANELMAHSYASLFNLPCTGLRFFTVYGPWGRPDMSLFIFTKSILEGRPIDVFNYGKHKRDFTYVDDIVEGLVRVLKTVPSPNPNWDSQAPDPASSRAPYRLYNIGNHQPVELMRVVKLLEDELGRKAEINFLPMQPGDVPETFAAIDDLARATGFEPSTSIEEGIRRFVGWYCAYHKISLPRANAHKL